MKYAEINRQFTDTVMRYLAKGMVINTGTMGGGTCVDLTDGNKITRVMVKKDYNSRLCCDCYQIVVGDYLDMKRATPNKPRELFGTIYDDELVIVEKSECFYNARYNKGGDWFVTENEIKAHDTKRAERFCARMDIERGKEVDISKKAAHIVLGYVRRQKRCKTAKVSDIRVIRCYGKGFLVIYKDHRWLLK